MKKLWIGLAVALAALMVHGSAPRASVPCSLPFNLQNATLADATQVMANYNAIITCLTNAAAAGVNTDITSIGGLTTPLTPAQGGTFHFLGTVASSGSANAQVVTTTNPTPFSLTPGYTVYFIPSFTNNSGMTLNVGGTGAQSVLVPSTTGPVAASGGEVVLNQVVAAQYSPAAGGFILLNPAPTNAVAAGTIIDYAGMAVPSGYLAANGAAVSRTTFSALFSAVSFTSAATTTSGSKIITGLSSTATLSAGMPVGGVNITCGDTIATVDSATQVTLLTNNAGASGATTLVFAPWGVGNCSTTFNTPNLTGRMTAGIDGATNITAATCTLSGTLGTLCGNQAHTQTLAEVASHSHTITDPGHTHTTPTGVVASAGPVLQALASATTGTSTTASSVTGITGTNASGSGAAMPILNPVAMVRKAVKF